MDIPINRCGNLEPLNTAHSRLKSARIRAGFATATAACKLFGWKFTTYRTHESGERQFNFETAKEYASAYKTSLSSLLFGEDSSTYLSKVSENTDERRRVLITGRVAGGEWIHEKVRKEFLVSESKVLPLPQFPAEAQFDLYVHGDSVNLFAQDGDYLRCLNLSIVALEISDGDLVIIERNTESDLIEMTARRIKILRSESELYFQSTKSCFQDKIQLNANTRIVAKVLFKYRAADSADSLVSE